MTPYTYITVGDGVEPCFSCKSVIKETRATYDNSFGLIHLCKQCTVDSGIAGGWDPDDCDDCGGPTAFSGPIKDCEDGVRCDTCKRPNGAP